MDGQHQAGGNPYLSPTELWSRVVLRWRLIVFCVWLFGAIFSLIALFSPRIYQATAILAPASAARDDDIEGLASSSLGGLASGLGFTTHDAQADEALAVLQSRELTERFIIEEGLLPKLYPGKWNTVSKGWKVDEAHQPTLAMAYNYFNKKIRSVSQDKKTNFIKLQIEWSDRAEAAQWTIDLVRRLNEEMRSRAIANADAAMHYLEAELASTSTVEVRNTISRLMETQIKQRMMAHVTSDYSLKFVDEPIASDGELPVRPQKVLLFVLGPFAGLVVGLMLVVLL